MKDPSDPGDRAEPAADISDATWAHNRWPTIGLYTGAGIGFAVGVVFVAGWLLTIAYTVGLGVLGLLVGLGLAVLIYGRADDGLSGGQLEPAGEDQQGDAAHQDASRGDDDVVGASRTEDDPQAHRQ